MALLLNITSNVIVVFYFKKGYLNTKKQTIMKKAILLSALMFIGMISNAQNYLGKSLKEVKTTLDNKSIYYEEFVNVKSTYSVRYTDESETRTYVFDYLEKCNFYVVQFEDANKIYNYAKQYAKQGYVLQKILDDRIKWIFKKGNIEVSCIYQEDIELYAIMVDAR